MKKALEKGLTQQKSLKNNYLPLVAIVSLLFISTHVHAQYDSTKLLQIVNAYGFDWKNGKFRWSLILPRDTPTIAAKDSGMIAFKGGKGWLNNGYGWTKIATVDDLPVYTSSNGITKSGTNFKLGGSITENTTITGDYSKNLSIDGLKTINMEAQDGFSFNGNGASNYMYGDWEVDNQLIANGKFLARDSSIFEGYGLLHKKFNYASNINGSFDDLSLVSKKYVDSLIALPNSNSWNKTGNAGTVDGTNFIGTTDNIPLNFRVNNQKSGRIDHINFNSFYGYLSGNANTTGVYNTAIGYNSLLVNTNGFSNTAIGHRSLEDNIDGAQNTAVGFGSLYSNTSGQYNTSIGYLADVGAGNLLNATAIGANAYVTANNCLVLGGITGINDGVDTKVGAGTTAPTERLHVVGNFRLVNGSQGADKVLVSDANGVSSWSGSMPRNLITNTTDVGNVGAGEDDLMTYSIPAGKLANDGDYLEFTITVIFAANANSKQVKLYYGATNFYSSTAQVQNDGSMEIKGTIIRTGATSQRITFSQVNNTTLFPDYASYATASETLANAITLKATGEATSDNDIIQKILTVKYFPAN